MILIIAMVGEKELKVIVSLIRVKVPATLYLPFAGNIRICRTRANEHTQEQTYK
jgi:hypothetical protein